MSDLLALYAPHAWFLALWVATPIALIAVMLRWVTPIASTPIPAVPVARRDVLAIALFAAFLCAYALLIPYGEDLVGADYGQLTAERFFAMPIWPYNRRFFPLGLQEYNFLGLLGKSAQWYHTFSIFQLLILLPALALLLAPAAVWFRCAVLAFLLVVPSFAISFFGLIYPERDLLFWMAIWLVAVAVHRRTRGRGSFAVALLVAQCMLYYKEIVFLFVGAFALGAMALDAYRDRSKKLAELARAHVLELSHLVLCAVFLGAYAFAMRASSGGSYAFNANRPGASLTALEFYVRWDPLLVALAMAVVLRVVLVATGKRVVEPMWDALAGAALVYVLAYVKLGMIRDYYAAPADMMAVLYLARFGLAESRNVSAVSRVAAVGVVALLFARNVRVLGDAALMRKEYVAANQQTVDALQRIAGDARDTLALFFPRIGGFQLMEFSAYLRQRGFYLPGDTVARRAGQPVAIVKGPHRFADGRCISSQYFRCEFAPRREPGDIVVYLPGPALSSREQTDLPTPLFHFVPGATPLERVLGRLAHGSIDDRPAHAYVFSP